jgi:hypothetical protein
MYLGADSTVDLAERFPPVWLRDNCACPTCRDPVSGQKLFGIEDLPPDLTVESVRQSDGAITVHFGPNGPRSVFELDWLLARPEVDPRTEDAKLLWSAADPAQAIGSWPRMRCDEFHRLPRGGRPAGRRPRGVRHPHAYPGVNCRAATPTSMP